MDFLLRFALPLEAQALVENARSNVGLIDVKVQRLAERSALLDQRTDQMSADAPALEIGMDLNSAKEDPIWKSDDTEPAYIGAIEFDDRKNAFRLVSSEPIAQVSGGARSALIEIDRRIGLRPDIGYHICEHGDVIPRGGAEFDHDAYIVAPSRALQPYS